MTAFVPHCWCSTFNCLTVTNLLDDDDTEEQLLEDMLVKLLSIDGI